MKNPHPVAEIEWREGLPYASIFQDVYFSTDNGLAESQFVFLEQNNLAARFSLLNSRNFTIAETGFGTGLNFLSTWQLWLETAAPNSQLHFISIEKYPLSITDLTQALAHWPELNTYSQLLLAQYQQFSAGLHQLSFAKGKVLLSLLIGDITEMLPQIETIQTGTTLNIAIDAWFLDGFSPAKNPDMWSSALFLQMAKLAHQHTTFATFSSAGVVRRGLQAVGFQVNKLAGFGKKREMLRGYFLGDHT